MQEMLNRLQAYEERLLKVKRLNVVLDEELHTKLKLTAFAQGITMSDYVKKLLEDSLLTEEEKKNREVK